MKSNVKSPLYFSAYPLKAITGSTAAGTTTNQNQSPYLRSVLAGKPKTSSRIRVFPMANPYLVYKGIPKPVKPVKDVEASGDDWFNHYE
ncbi:MAG TPA: hypothetical protein VFX58_02405 [Chitinophagaceae bacterium]|nr:hypothetical protein [Chitinophagaceae bacterium]